MIGFLKENKSINVILILYNIIIWSYVSLTPMILTKYYGYSETILSFATNIFLITTLSSAIYFNTMFENKIKFKNLLNITLLLFILSLLVLTLITKYNLPKELLYIAKGLEGMGWGLMTVKIGYIYKLILLSNDKNAMINAVKTSIVYLLKAVMPIIFSYIFLIEGKEYMVFAVSMLFYILFLIYVARTKKSIYNQIQNKIDNYQGKIEKKSFIKNLKTMLNFYKGELLKEKIYFTLINFFQNASRPFYDLYMVIFLINVLNYSVVETASILSFMVMGQASQFISSYILKYVSVRIYRILGIIIYAIPFLLIINYYDILKQNILYLYVLFFIFGFGRSFYANYSYIYVMELSKKIKINQIDFATMIFAELSHNIAYFIYGIIMLNGVKIEELFHLWYVLLAGLVLVWFLFDLREDFLEGEAKEEKI